MPTIARRLPARAPTVTASLDFDVDDDEGAEDEVVTEPPDPPGFPVPEGLETDVVVELDGVPLAEDALAAA